MNPSKIPVILLTLFSVLTLSHPLSGSNSAPVLSDLWGNTTLSVEPVIASSMPDTYDNGDIVFDPASQAQELFCETSNASPHIVNVHQVANNLIAESTPTDVCWQLNSFGSKCHQITSFKDAQISICNGGGPKGVKCRTVAWAAKHISNNCQRKDGKTGGYYKFIDLRLRIAIH